MPIFEYYFKVDFLIFKCGKINVTIELITISRSKKWHHMLWFDEIFCHFAPKKGKNGQNWPFLRWRHSFLVGYFYIWFSRLNRGRNVVFKYTSVYYCLANCSQEKAHLRFKKSENMMSQQFFAILNALFSEILREMILNLQIFENYITASIQPRKPNL